MIAKKFRIKRESIAYILKKGASYKSGLFIVKYLQSTDDNDKFAIIISKKMSKKAVTRNLLKRRIYEAIRQQQANEGKKHFNIIIIPKKITLEKEYNEIEADIKNIFHGKIK